MAEHTPGPWDVSALDVLNKEHSHLIARCWGDIYPPFEIAKANARLIAAAPELLAALEQCVAAWGIRDVFLLPEEKRALDAARAAIAKAKGESK